MIVDNLTLEDFKANLETYKSTQGYSYNPTGKSFDNQISILSDYFSSITLTTTQLDLIDLSKIISSTELKALGKNTYEQELYFRAFKEYIIDSNL